MGCEEHFIKRRKLHHKNDEVPPAIIVVAADGSVLLGVHSTALK
jgi:hypothetical protein